MSPSMDFDLKERVRMAVDIVDVIGSHLELTPQGRGFVARCPWHDDRRPSLQVNPQRQTWKCWVCDIGGDAFSYVMRRDGVDFVDALKSLAEKAGIDYTPAGGKKVVAGSPEDKQTLLAAMKFAATAYFEFFESDSSEATQRARQYLEQRGISEDSRRRFQIGFAPASWSWLLDEAQRAGFTGDVLRAAGLAVARQGGSGFYDLFRGRLMFPIIDLQDRTISMGGRIIPGGDCDTVGAKYINGPETRLFSKSRQLYGLNLARGAMQKTGHALVMEGYTDVIAARQAGIEPVVAVLGTALGEHHIEILQRFVDRVVLVLDGDEVGRKRADSVLELFVGAKVDLRIITLPGGADPADFVAEHGREALEKLVAEAPDALDHKLATLTQGVDLTHDTHRATAALEKMLAVLARGGDPNDLRAAQMLVRLSRTFAIPTEDLRNQLVQRIRQASRRNSLPQRHQDGRVPTQAAAAEVAPLAPISGADQELFEIMIGYPESVAQAIELIDPQWLTSNTSRMLMRAYQQLELQGRDLDLATLMLAIDDERLKGVLVRLDELSRRRSEHSTQSYHERFRVLIQWYHQQQSSFDSRRQITRLEATGDETLLDDIIAAQQLKMGIRPK